MPLSGDELKLLQAVVGLPTAPFHESAVQAFAKAWAAQRGIACSSDRAGNLLLEYPGKGRQSGKPWVLQAHMDHPGFSFVSRRGRRALAMFRGGVAESYFPGERICFFPPGSMPVGGSVRSVRRDAETGFLRCMIELEAARTIPVGTPGMWDLPVWRRRGPRLELRAADDLAGVAAVLLALGRLKDSGAGKRCVGLLTRAEEVGFVGAISAAKLKSIDPSWPVLGIECSKEQPSARLGKGGVVRVGDRSTIFDPQLTAMLRHAARDLAPLPFSESLMPGGSTESTGLALMGYRTCAVCLPLGNYHNMGSQGIAPERIHLGDLEALVALLVRVAQTPSGNISAQTLKKRLLTNHFRLNRLL